MADVTLEALLEEGRLFPPPPDFVAGTLVTDGAPCATVPKRDSGGVLGRAGPRPAALGHRVSPRRASGSCPFAKWFTGGKLNVSFNCLDRHVADGHGDQVAILWEGEPGDARSIRLPRAPRRRGAGRERAEGARRRGDRVAIYMGMGRSPGRDAGVPRIGAAHSVVFGGFTADSFRDRINDAEARVLVTGNGAWRRGSIVPLKEIADEAIAETPSIEKCLVLRRTEQDVAMTGGRDVWGTTSCRLIVRLPAGVDGRRGSALHPLHQRHHREAQGHHAHDRGYLTQVVFTTKYVFDLHPETDVYWCTADCGWVTGHSYIVYGPLANRATSVMYEGTPDHPGKDRFWSIVEKYGVTILYTAPNRIPTFMKWGTEFPEGTTCRRCGCSARSASPSIPRPGSGTGSTSAGASVRSSTRGGRPRPAPS